MDKFAAIKTTSSKIDRLLIEHIRKCAELRDAIDNMISEPQMESVEKLQLSFNNAKNHLEILSNAISTLAQQVISENGELEQIDGEADENGIRLQ